MTALSNIPGLDAALNAIKQGSTTGQTNEDGSIRGTFKELPFDREFRAEIVESNFKASNSGAPGIRYVLQIVGEPEYEGSKVWDNVYFTGHEFQGQRLAVLLGAAGATADSIEEAATKLVGAKVVIALQEGNDPAYPQTRWVSIDQGQKLKTGIKPKASKQPAQGLQAAPDVVAAIKAQQQAPTAPVTVQAPAQAPAEAAPAAPAPAAAPGGIKLPGMG